MARALAGRADRRRLSQPDDRAADRGRRPRHRADRRPARAAILAALRAPSSATPSSARTSQPGRRPLGPRRRADAWVDARARAARDRARLHVLRLPVGDRLAAVAVRARTRTPTSTTRSSDGRDATIAELDATGVAGGDTRFQVFARVVDVTQRTSASRSRPTSPTTTCASPTLVRVYAGADWHEREAWEMFGIDFVGHPDLRTSTCRASSRASRCARTSRCWPAS